MCCDIACMKKVICQVPLAEMFGFGKALPRLSGGRGSFSMRFERYEQVPEADAKKIIESAKREEEDED